MISSCEKAPSKSNCSAAACEHGLNTSIVGADCSVLVCQKCLTSPPAEGADLAPPKGCRACGVAIFRGFAVPHLLLTSALLFALLAIVAVAIGASLRIAHDLLFEGADEEAGEEVGLGHHAATLAPAHSETPHGVGSRNSRI